MQNSFFRLATAASVAFGLTAAQGMAQDNGTTPVTNLSMGEEVNPDNAPGSIYLRDTTGDWEVRCQRAGEGQIDPCNLYQLLRDEGGQAVAEMTMFAMPEGQEAVAGAQIITPLETLLTQQVRLSVDGGSVKRYPFAYCTTAGCISQIGLTQGDVDSFRRGANGKLTIVPARAPDGATVDLSISLSGFTAGFKMLQEITKEAIAAQAAAQEDAEGEAESE